MLQWKVRLVVLATTLALLVVALGGGVLGLSQYLDW